MIDLASIADEFAAFACLHGAHVEPGKIIPDRWQRWASHDRPRRRDVATMLHADGAVPIGLFCDHRTGLRLKYRPDTSHAMTASERADLARIAAQRDARRRQEQERAALRAVEIIARASPADQRHGYLIAKDVPAMPGVVQSGGRLVIPARDTAGRLRTLQFIDAAGNKRFLTGGAKRSAYFSMGPAPVATLALAEGYATSADVHVSTGIPVACCFDAGNVAVVAVALRRKFPRIEFVICADNDASGRGGEAAREAVKAAGGARIVMPPSTGDDFNDLRQREGLDAVRNLILGGVHG